MILTISLFTILSFSQPGDTTKGYEKFEMEEPAVFRKKFSPKDPFEGDFTKNIKFIEKKSLYEHNQSKIIFDVPSPVKSMETRHVAVNRLSSTTDGYRIQIYTGIDRENSNKAKISFIERHPSIEIYQEYVRPNFRIRVGDFLNKQEAEIFKNTLQDLFQGAFVVRDRVNKPRFKDKDNTKN